MASLSNPNTYSPSISIIGTPVDPVLFIKSMAISGDCDTSTTSNSILLSNKNFLATSHHGHDGVEYTLTFLV